MKPLLLYHQDLRFTNQLIEGRLLLIDEETRTIKNTYIATSGLPGNQSYDSLASRGNGPIPPISLAGLDSCPIIRPRSFDGWRWTLLPSFTFKPL